MYKRRIACSKADWDLIREGGVITGQSEQIQHELQQMLAQYPDLQPRVYVGYDRTAYADDEDGLRITFDENLRTRTYDLDLSLGAHGTPLLAPGQVVMEVKFPGSAPLWLAHMLSECGIFPTSFSKYGRWYQNRCRTQAAETAAAV